MDAFNWMLKKTATIPEVRPVDEGLLFGRSHSTPSTFKQFNVLVYFTFLYHILFSKYIKKTTFRIKRGFAFLKFIFVCFRFFRCMELIKVCPKEEWANIVWFKINLCHEQTVSKTMLKLALF